MGASGRRCRDFQTIFPRFWSVLDQFWEPMLEPVRRFVDDLSGFGSVLGQFWGPMLEPVWKPRRPEIGKMSFFVPFFRASNRDAVFETISRRFL